RPSFGLRWLVFCRWYSLLISWIAIKNAKFDLFRAHYHAGFPALRQTAREYRKLLGGFFCRFKSKYPRSPWCRGPPQKTDTTLTCQTDAEMTAVVVFAVSTF
ncbi:MAG: hypothetical protein K2N78_05920, partial [Oscillospiraceae bacterium]|nr:hypothetical protein [Oscillospiraceae bacterium]